MVEDIVRFKIPDGWKVGRFHDVLEGFFSGATPRRNHPEYYNGNIKWVTSGELDYNVITNTIEKITLEGKEKTNLKLLPKGTFLMAITGLEAAGTRGRCAILGVNATTNQSCMAIFSTNKMETSYLYYYYVFKGEDLALKYCQGTKQQSYTAKIVKILPITYPKDINEQIRISTTLRDIDNLLQSLEKLIDKKKKIKQGTMQQLLTGKKRLSGFSGEWEVKTLGSITTISRGQLITEKDSISGPIPVIAGGIEPSYYHIKANRLGKTITISASGANAGYVGFHNQPIFASDCSTISEGAEYNIEFVYYQLKLLQEKIYSLQTGGAQPHIHPKDLIPLVINYTHKAEQNKIAEILLNMDSEIGVLEQKLEKYKKIKQGMMQELLTGRIRLI